MSEELHPLEAITSLYLVRHGHTKATELGLLYSDPNIEITEKGLSQAQAAAQYIATIKPQILLRGAARRVEQSSEPVAAETGLDARVVKGFEEWQVGDWEGRTYLDIKKNDPDQYHSWCANPIANAPPKGESIIQLSERIKESLIELIADSQFEGKTIAMVTHSGIIRSIIVHALGMPIANFWRLSIPTGSITRIDFSKNFATMHFMAHKP
ncbi:histidine phosphatase family protein [soil metagenome]